MASAVGPVGHVDQQVIFHSLLYWLLPRPYGESQVVANKQVDPPSFYRCNKPFASGGLLRIFSCKCKAMAFIIYTILTRWQHPDKPVEITISLLCNDATGKDDPFIGGHALHPLQRSSLH